MGFAAGYFNHLTLDMAMSGHESNVGQSIHIQKKIKTYQIKIIIIEKVNQHIFPRKTFTYRAVIS